MILVSSKKAVDFLQKQWRKYSVDQNIWLYNIIWIIIKTAFHCTCMCIYVRFYSSNKPNHQCFVLSLLWHFPYFDIYLESDMPNRDKEHTAGATDQQGMLTSPRHLIPPLSFLEVRVVLLWICISLYGFLRWLTVCYCHFSF